MDEQILKILTQIQSDLSDVKSRLINVESDVRSIKLYQENVLDKNIHILAENVSSANERLISIESDLTDLKDNQTISDVFTELAAAFSRK
ncbi:MAG: hypothetical protein ACI4KB_08190 [Oscillospiraceae bacterium]|nr:hypothetical protein [Oscillospiraceae bacterium]